MVPIRAALLALASTWLLLACGRPAAAPAHPATPAPAAAATRAPVSESRVAMGSLLTVTIWSADASAAQAAIAEVFREFDRLEDLMSTWRAGSDVLRLNAAAGRGPVKLSPEVIEVLGLAHHYSELTGGKFDVTFAALSGLWRFDQDMDRTVPSRAAIAARLPLVRWQDLVIDAAAGTAELRRRGMSVNLGGIGKGYAVDRAIAILRRRGFADFLVQAGGDLYVGGHPRGRAWRLGIQDPRGPADTPFAALELSDATCSTSGDYERFFIKGGRRYHHILDPATGQPAMASRSVTLVTAKAVEADALAKAVFILGPEQGLALVARFPGVEAVIVGAHNEVRVSPGLRERLALLAPPTDAP
jgi:FAD:protein FMN transferase